MRSVDEHYEVVVPLDLHAKAKAIAEEGCLDFSDTPEDQKIMELPDSNVDSGQRHHGNQSWKPDDATAEIWSEEERESAEFEKVEGRAWMIELSLKENRIQARVDVQNRSRRIFVLPEDECAAREIVREIVQGTAPT